MQHATIWKHLKTLELDYRTESSGEIVQFRLELFGTDARKGNLKKYRSRALKYDLFALKPSFQPSPVGGEQFDHELAVVEPFTDNT